MSRRRLSIRLSALRPCAALLALAACSSGGKFAPACPGVAIVADASDLTRYNGRGQDLTDLVLDGRITGVSGQCKQGDDPGIVDTTISVSLELTRGPAAQGRGADLAYFVAVTRNGAILDKQVYPLRAEFPSNTDRLRLAGDQVELLVPVPKGLSGAAFTILVGFQLDEAQLQFNRSRGPR